MLGAIMVLRLTGRTGLFGYSFTRRLPAGPTV